MLRINWVDPDTLRFTDQVTGTVSIGGIGIEVQVELFGQGVYPETQAEYVQRALQLLNTAHINLVHFQEPEPEPELGPLNFPFPEPEPEPTFSLEELSEFQ